MKEIMCIIRLNKVNQTKDALAEAGFPSITCRKVLETIIDVNKTETPGDGKIFVLPIEESYRVRDGKSGEEVI